MDSNTPSEVGAWMSHILNLSRELLRALDATVLVRILASCCSNLTKGKTIMPSLIFSLMKYLSISTCFVRSYWTGLLSISMAGSDNSTLTVLSFATGAKVSW